MAGRHRAQACPRRARCSSYWHARPSTHTPPLAAGEVTDYPPALRTDRRGPQAAALGAAPLGDGGRARQFAHIIRRERWAAGQAGRESCRGTSALTRGPRACWVTTAARAGCETLPWPGACSRRPGHGPGVGRSPAAVAGTLTVGAAEQPFAPVAAAEAGPERSLRLSALASTPRAAAGARLAGPSTRAPSRHPLQPTATAQGPGRGVPFRGWNAFGWRQFC